MFRTRNAHINGHYHTRTNTAIIVWTFNENRPTCMPWSHTCGQAMASWAFSTASNVRNIVETTVIAQDKSAPSRRLRNVFVSLILLQRRLCRPLFCGRRTENHKKCRNVLTPSHCVRNDHQSSGFTSTKYRLQAQHKYIFVFSYYTPWSFVPITARMFLYGTFAVSSSIILKPFCPFKFLSDNYQ